MRITSGAFRGRTLKVPPGEGMRPTQDRVREALFSMLGEAVRGAAFLDLFAGSGAVGLEALSRGASRATFVECAPRHLACLKANIAVTGASASCSVVAADVFAWLARPPSPGAFDVVFADPPYALGVEKGHAGILTALSVPGRLASNGLVIVEMTAQQTPEEVAGWELLRDRTYGQTRLAVYRFSR